MPDRASGTSLPVGFSEMRLLLVEDDAMIGKSIREGLRRDGYVVDWVRDGWAGEHALGEQTYDLLLLDLGLPRKNGIEVLNSARRTGKTLPVLVITARDSVEDRVSGLDAGADDYLVKPFSMPELRARVRALLRRSSGRSQSILKCGELELDTVDREVRLRGERVALSVRELVLIERLLHRVGATVSKAALEHSVYGWGEEVESNAIEVHVSNLRKKLGASIIETVRGMGYRMRA